MSSNLKRLDKVEKQVAALPHIITAEENHKWAERQIDELMAEFDLSLDEAIELAKQHAPTIIEFLRVTV
ncbi:MAG TPA: hypothetical protein VJT71_10015 [Pyrinomonadaceae bacterium]|nr:hypothetical protein [Pyrinomonadaceae bacterium]